MSAMNNDFAETLRRWFVSMGYPLEDVADTDWNSLCCGRLPVFWKKTMRVVKSKQELNNIRRNILLREIKNFERREDSSATKLGFILPPPEIHYPNEQAKLSKKLVTLQEELNNKKETLRKINNERKRKCYEMNEIKKDITNIGSQTYSMKLIKQKLENNIGEYNVMHETIQRLNHLFKDPNENQQISEVEFREFQKQLFSYSHKEEIINGEMILSNDSGLMSNSLPNVTVICKNEKLLEINSAINEVETFELLNLINKHHKDIPFTIDKSVSMILDAKSKEINSYIDSGEFTTYKKGLLKMDLVHVQIIIETLRIKKDTKKAKETASMIKSEILRKLSVDNSKIQAFKHQCSLFTGIAYNKTISKELTDLKAKVGFYSKFNNVQINKIISCENPYLTLQNCKKDYLQLYSHCVQKLKDILSYINDLNVLNKNISKNVKQLSKITSSEKILWDSENDYLQDLYMKVVLNNPNAFRFEKENTFEALIHLQQITTEFNFNVRLEDTSNLISIELERFKTYGINSSRFLFERSKEQKEKLVQQFDESRLLLNYEHMEYLRPTKYFVLSLTRLYKFLSLLFKFTNLECDSDIPKIIKHYLEKNLENQEELLLSRIDERFPKTFVTVITKPILNDFYNTNNFFIEYSKHKEMHETSEMF